MTSPLSKITKTEDLSYVIEMARNPDRRLKASKAFIQMHSNTPEAKALALKIAQSNLEFWESRFLSGKISLEKFNRNLPKLEGRVNKAKTDLERAREEAIRQANQAKADRSQLEIDQAEMKARAKAEMAKYLSSS